jgi:hypothetical protein
MRECVDLPRAPDDDRVPLADIHRQYFPSSAAADMGKFQYCASKSALEMRENNASVHTIVLKRGVHFLPYIYLDALGIELLGEAFLFASKNVRVFSKTLAATSLYTTFIFLKSS